MDEQLLKELREIAASEAANDGEELFIPMEACGGNYDDAYDMGCRDGEIHLARTILKGLRLDG